MAESLDELKHNVALSCRILAMMGLVKDTLGHVSARVPGSSSDMLIRCRGNEEEAGLLFTTDNDIRRVDFDGNGADLTGGYHSPGEVSIHGESMRLRPDVGCVIHAHPPGALMCGVGGVEFRPIAGSYDGGFTLTHALDGVPVFPHAYLISRPELAHRLVAFTGAKHVCIMRGHGVTITGATVEETTVRALRFEAMCRIHWQLALSGRTPLELDQEDFNEHARSRSAAPSPLAPRTGGWIWKYYVKLLESGASLPVSVGVGDIEI